MVERLGQARTWLLKKEEVDELEKITLGEERQNVARWRWQSLLTLRVTILFDGQIQAYVGDGLFFTSDIADLRASYLNFREVPAFA